MGTQSFQLYCYRCQAETGHIKSTTSHTFHLLMTVFTLGLWWLIWLLMGLLSVASGSRCSHCGATYNQRLAVKTRARMSSAPAPHLLAAAPAERTPMRQCPYCAEDIRAEAIKCKHCNSAVEPVSFRGFATVSSAMSAPELPLAKLPEPRSHTGVVLASVGGLLVLVVAVGAGTSTTPHRPVVAPLPVVAPIEPPPPPPPPPSPKKVARPLPPPKPRAAAAPRAPLIDPFAPAGEAPAPDGSACINAIIDPASAACRTVYCGHHPSDIRCEAEPVTSGDGTDR